MSDPFSNNPAADPFMTQGNAEAIKFDTPGQITTLTVRRVEQKIDTQPDGTVKTWANGDPMHVFIFHGTVDGEERTLWVRGNMVTAIREAVTAAKLASVVDTNLTLKFTEFGTPTQKGFSPPKLFKAKVEKAAPLAATPGFDDEEPF